MLSKVAYSEGKRLEQQLVQHIKAKQGSAKKTGVLCCGKGFDSLDVIVIALSGEHHFHNYSLERKAKLIFRGFYADSIFSS